MGIFCINKFINYNKDLNIRILLINNLHKNINKLIFNKNNYININKIKENFGVL